jgi:membrane protein
MKIKNLMSMILRTFHACAKDNISHLSASLSYYTIFSLAPILVIFLALGGIAFGQNIFAHDVFIQIKATLGQSTAVDIKNIISNVQRPSTNIFASIIAISALAWAMIGLFGELQYCFDIIWDVSTSKDKSLLKMLKGRLLSFTTLIGIGFLLLVSLIMSAFITKLSSHLNSYIHPDTFLWVIVDFIISVFSITFLFSVTFKVLTHVTLQWSDVLIGSLITSIFFAIGKFFLSIYLAKSSMVTAYGSAASLVIILVWVYYSAQIMFFGAEFTKLYTYEHGSLKNH